MKRKVFKEKSLSSVVNGSMCESVADSVKNSVRKITYNYVHSYVENLVWSRVGNPVRKFLSIPWRNLYTLNYYHFNK